MGLIRLALAFLVVGGHAGFQVGNIGLLMAVQVFFVLSGVYMAAVYTTTYSKVRNGIWLFYLNRVLRLWPTYLLILGLTCIAFIAVGSAVRQDFRIFSLFTTPLSTEQLLYLAPANLLLFGQDVLSVDEPTHFLLPVRQSWSIATELLFYLFVPFIYRRNFSLFVGSIIILASFALKFYLLQTMNWRVAYFFPLGNMGYFFLGCFIYHVAEIGVIARLRNRLGLAARILAPIAFAVLALAFKQNNFETGYFGQHFAFLAAFSLIVILAFSQKTWWIDTYLGNISYGVYLNHFLLMVLVANFWPLPQPAFLIVVFLASLLLSMITERVLQRPIDSFRRSLTRRAQDEGLSYFAARSRT